MDLKTYQDWLSADVQARFLRYVRVHTTSDRHGRSIPSTTRQFDLANILADELRAFGIADVAVTDKCYVIARIPSNVRGSAPCLGLLAHVDTAPDTSGESVNPRVFDSYDGKSIELGHGRRLDPVEYPDLLAYVGETIITTDGSTLLGADDKAGVAEIMTAVRFLTEHPEFPHGELEIIFTPDEEIGRGIDGLDLDTLHSKYAVTMDGGKEGSIEAECFTAFKARVSFDGYVIHPGSAKNKMANAIAMAGRFISMLPLNESPEATDGRDGFYCPIEVRADYGKAYVDLIIRDFELTEVQRRIAYLEQLAKTIELQFPRGRVRVESEKQYLNMRDVLAKHPFVMETIEAAVRDTGLEPIFEPIRGGTDGARLTEMGIPTPNIFAGGFNFHGQYEWVPVRGMRRAAETILHLVRRWAERPW